MHSETPYEIIGVSRDATPEEIKKQHRALVKQHHPDVARDDDRQRAEERFIRLQAAYELLSDPERKAEYDAQHKLHPLAANQAFQAYIAKRKKAFDQRTDLAAVGWADAQKYEQNVKMKYWSQKGEEEARRQTHKEQASYEKKYNSISNKHMLVLKKRDAENRKAAADAQAALAMKLLADEGFELEDDSSPSEMLQLKGKETKTPGMLDA